MMREVNFTVKFDRGLSIANQSFTIAIYQVARFFSQSERQGVGVQ